MGSSDYLPHFGRKIQGPVTCKTQILYQNIFPVWAKYFFFSGITATRNTPPWPTLASCTLRCTLCTVHGASHKWRKYFALSFITPPAPRWSSGQKVQGACTFYAWLKKLFIIVSLQNIFTQCRQCGFTVCLFKCCNFMLSLSASKVAKYLDWSSHSTDCNKLKT